MKLVLDTNAVSALMKVANYPTLTPEGLQAVFAFAAESPQDESLYSLRLRTA